MSHEEEMDLLAEHARGRLETSDIPPPGRTLELENPLCGDASRLSIQVENGAVQDVHGTATGCFICKASTSIIGSAVVGLQVEEAVKLLEEFRSKFIGGEKVELIGDLPLLMGFQKYPARVKCVLLPFDVLRELLKKPH